MVPMLYLPSAYLYRVSADAWLEVAISRLVCAVARLKNSPEPETYERLKMESRSELASAKANAGLKADLYVQFGLSQTGNKLADTYRDPLKQQYASIGISLPILDWGRGKGRVRVARSNVDLVNTQAEQALKDSERRTNRRARCRQD